MSVRDEIVGDGADPVTVQTRADTSQRSQTKHGRIIRAIIQQQSSRSAHCEPVSLLFERAQRTLSFSPKLNSLNVVLLSYECHLGAPSLISSNRLWSNSTMNFKNWGKKITHVTETHCFESL